MTTILDVTKKFLDQDSRWSQVLAYAESRNNPAAPAARKFLKGKWEGALHRYIDKASTQDYNATIDPNELNRILSAFHLIIYPNARRVGFPDSSFLFDDIGMDSDSDTNVSGFFDFLSIKKDDWQDKFFNDIDPILKFLPYGPALEQAHKARLEMGDSKTEDKGVTDMTASMATALKIHDTIVKAKKGDADSTKTLAAIKAQADAGDPAAIKAMDTAKKINNTLNVKAAKAATATVTAGYHIGVTVRDHRPGGGATGGFVTGPQGTPVRAPANPGYTNTQAPVSQYPDPSQYGGGYPDPSQMGGYGAPPMNPYAPYGAPPPNPYGYAPTPYGYTDPYSMAYAASPYGGGYAPPMDYSQIPGHMPGDDYGPYYQFSGWGYNRPYRASVPAPKHRLRSLYNLGLGG